MPGPLNRIEPKAGPDAFKTYQITAPSSTHRRRAMCSEVGCEKRKRGYKAQFDVSTTAGRANAHMVESLKGRRMWSRRVEGPLVTYTFPAGQDCLDVHTVPLEREPLYIVRGGDHRGNPRKIPSRQMRPADFVDDWATHQSELHDRIARG
jgi:hypothetical protein